MKNTLHIHESFLSVRPNAELRRYGHTLGLDLEITLPSTGRSIGSEGNIQSISMHILSELLDKYVSETNDSAIMKKISEIIAHHTVLNSVDFITLISFIFDLDAIKIHNYFANLIKNIFYNKNSLKCHGIYLGALFASHHGFYVAYDDKILALSDRCGLGVRIFALKPGSYAKLNFPVRRFKTPIEFHQYYASFTNGSIELDSKEQKIGICTFVNYKSLIKALLAMVGGNIAESMLEYKKFSTWLRKHEVTELIKKYLIAKQSKDADLTHVYKSLLLAYIQTNKPPVYKPKTGLSAEESIQQFMSFNRKEHAFATASNISRERRNANIALIYANLKDDDGFLGCFDETNCDLETLVRDLSLEKISPDDLQEIESSINPPSRFSRICKGLFAPFLLIYALAILAIIFLFIIISSPFTSIKDALTPKPGKFAQSTPIKCDSRGVMLEKNVRPLIISKIYSDESFRQKQEPEQELLSPIRRARTPLNIHC